MYIYIDKSKFFLKMGIFIVIIGNTPILLVLKFPYSCTENQAQNLGFFQYKTLILFLIGIIIGLKKVQERGIYYEKNHKKKSKDSWL